MRREKTIKEVGDSARACAAEPDGSLACVFFGPAGGGRRAKKTRRPKTAHTAGPPNAGRAEAAAGVRSAGAPGTWPAGPAVPCPSLCSPLRSLSPLFITTHLARQARPMRQDAGQVVVEVRVRPAGIQVGQDLGEDAGGCVCVWGGVRQPAVARGWGGAKRERGGPAASLPLASSGARATRRNRESPRGLAVRSTPPHTQAAAQLGSACWRQWRPAARRRRRHTLQTKQVGAPPNRSL